MKRYAVIVAGGQGLRMGGDIPKQYIPIGGKPILMHTIDQFVESDAIVVVLPRDHHDYWAELCMRYEYVVPHVVCSGGDTRFASVAAGLQILVSSMGDQESALVAIHDGVRPFVTKALIEQAYIQAEACQAVVPVVPVIDSLRQCAEMGESYSVDRAGYRSVQTPQVFDFARLRYAYKQGYKATFTDDASVWEACYLTYPIQMIEGNTENIKITTPMDLYIAEYILRGRQSS